MRKSYLVFLHFKLNCKREESRKKSREAKKNEPSSNLVRDRLVVGTSEESNDDSLLLLLFSLLFLAKVSRGAGGAAATTLEALEVEVVDDDEYCFGLFFHWFDRGHKFLYFSCYLVDNFIPKSFYLCRCNIFLKLA